MDLIGLIILPTSFRWRAAKDTHIIISKEKSSIEKPAVADAAYCAANEGCH
jgi:hypothetical protein